MTKGGEEKEVIRLTISFPLQIYESIEIIRKRQHRPFASVVIEACDIFVNNTAVREATMIAEKSPEYQVILAQLKKDLGLPPQTHQE